MKAVKCPICEGEGELFHYTSTIRGEPDIKHMKCCHGCKGEGWVTVPEDSWPSTWPQWETGDDLDSPNTADYSKCPACGDDRNNPALTGCPKGSHYGSYSYRLEVTSAVK